MVLSRRQLDLQRYKGFERCVKLRHSEWYSALGKQKHKSAYSDSYGTDSFV